VQVHADAEVDKGQFFGRVEHIVTGQATRFDSDKALVEFITQVLKAQSASNDENGST
jgi:hypothetical protein